MSTRKIGELPERKVVVPCTNPEHLPTTTGLDVGVYEHICPGCNHKTIFTVNKPPTPPQ
jgi:hypothetical protein